MCAGGQRAQRLGLVGDAHHHLAAIEAGRRDAVRGIGREAVIELEAKPGQSTAIHRAKNDLALQGPEQRQVIDDVGRAQDAIDTGPFQRDQQPAQQLAAVGHRHRVRPGFQNPARGMVGGDQKEGAPLQQGPALAPGQRLLHSARVGRSSLGKASQQLVGGDGHVLESATTDISKE